MQAIMPFRAYDFVRRAEGEVPRRKPKGVRGISARHCPGLAMRGIHGYNQDGICRYCGQPPKGTANE